MNADTIVAVASPPGRSTRAIVRVSGAGVAALCERVLERPAVVGIGANRLRVPGLAEFPVLAIRFQGPRSYTGEDVLEILLPGNPHLVERVVWGLIEIDGAPDIDVVGRVRLAQPGEFTARAYFHGKLTLEQAEGVAATIAARTNEQLEAAALLRSGTIGARYHAIADQLAVLLALVESGIDFTDQEDVVPIAPALLRQRLEALRERVVGEGTSVRESGHALPTAALVGAPNAGKSTLFNALLGRARAIANPSAGTTRDVLAEEVDLSRDAPGAGKVFLLDLPGLDERVAARSGVDRLAQEAALRAIEHADVLVWCDPSGRFDMSPESPLASVGVSTERLLRSTIRVRTFGDRPEASARTDSGADSSASVPAISVCALDGWNLATLRRTLADVACSAGAANLAALLPRHRSVLSRVVELLAEAIATIDPTSHALREPELVADSLRTALDQMGELAGQISPDEVLGRVFSTFCVGK